MAVFRIEKTRDYTVMSNHHLKNKNLTLKAKGLMSLLLSLPDDWVHTLAGLAQISVEGVGNIKNYLLTTLYNAVGTIKHYYDARVRHEHPLL